MMEYICVYKRHAEYKRPEIEREPEKYRGLLRCLGCNGFDKECNDVQMNFINRRDKKQND